MNDWLTTLCASVLCVGFIGSVWFYQYPHSVVYACSDKEKNPPDVQQLCKELTKAQWWGAYYQGVKK